MKIQQFAIVLKKTNLLKIKNIAKIEIIVIKQVNTEMLHIVYVF